MRPRFIVVLAVMLAGLWPAESRADPSPPRPPDNVKAYSRYDTPSTMTLTWVDPTHRENGSPILPFEIIIRRDGTPIDTIPRGVGTFRDTRLSDGTFYTYEFRSREIETEFLSEPVTAGWHAGGDPVPAPPTNVIVSASSGGYQLRWTNPSTQRDGTPLDDLGGVRIRRNGAYIVFLPAGVSSYLDTTAPTNSLWDVSVSDTERPPHTSDWSVPAEAPPASPNVQVSTATVAIVGTVGGPVVARTLPLRNVGDLNLPFAIVWSSAWLRVAPESGTVAAFATADIQLTADPAGLPEGDHTDTLVVTTNDPDSPRVTVPVRFTVGRSRLRVQPDILLFSISILDASRTLPLELENTGSADVTFSVATTSHWLTIESAQNLLRPGTRYTTHITATRTQAVGLYRDSLIVLSNDLDAPRRVIPVFLEVTTAPPTIGTSRSILTFVGYTAGSEQRQSLGVSNTGADTLVVSVRTTQDWIRVTPASLAVPTRDVRFLDVIAVPETLGIGNYSGEVVFESNDPLKPVTTVPVTLEVRDGSPRVAVSVDTLLYPNAACGDPGKSIIVSNPGPSVLRATISTSEPWLTTAWTTFQVNAGGAATIPMRLTLPLPARGVNRALIALTTNAPANPTVEIPVIVPNLSPRAELGTRDLFFVVSRGGPPVSLPIHIRNVGESPLEVSAAVNLPQWLSAPGGLSLNPGDEGDFVCTAAPAGLPVGRGEALLTLQTNNCGERIVIRVRIEINEGPPGLKVLDDSLTFDAPEDSPPVGKGFRLANYAPVPLRFTVEESSPWLLVEPEAGTIAPGGRIQVSVMSAPAGLPPGEYDAAFFIGSDHPDNPVVRRTVRLAVRDRVEAADRNIIAIREIGTVCAGGDETVQFIELVTPRDVTYRAAIGLKIHNARGETVLDITNLFGLDREGTPWYAGETWLLTTAGSVLAGIPGDKTIAPVLDPRGGTLTLYDAGGPGTIYQRFSYGITADLPAPPPGMSLLRESPGVFHVAPVPTPRRSGGPVSEFACDCPINTLVTGTLLRTTDPARSVVNAVSGRIASAAYDLPAGTLLSEALRTTSTVEVEDVYFVIGDRAGSPISFEAVLKVTGTLSSTGTHESGRGATLTATLEDATAGVVVDRRLPGDAATVEDEIVLPVRTSYLTPFHLKSRLSATAGVQGAESRGAGQIEFRGLPAGARVLSCQGFDQNFGAAPVVTVLESSASAGHARLVWSVPGGRRFVTVQRRVDVGPWIVVGSAEVLPIGRAEFEEDGLDIDRPYTYRVLYGETTGGDVTINAGPPPQLAIRAVFPNPARGGALWLTISLPDNGGALVELFDVAGRRVLEKDLSRLGPGEIRVNVTEGMALASGVYLARLTKGRESRSIKAVVLR